MYSLYSIELMLFVNVLCTKSSFELTHHDILPILDNLKNEKEFGVLHTLEKYAEWSKKEENLFTVFPSRLNLLQLEMISVKRLLLAKKRNSNFLKTLSHCFKSYNRERISFDNNELSKIIGLDKQKWVGSEDLLMSTTGIGYLQEVYLIPSEQMITGLPMESTFGGYLSKLDCVIQSLFSLINNYFATAVNWLQSAVQQASRKFAPDWISIMLSIGIKIHNSRLFELLSKNYENAIHLGKNSSMEDLYSLPILNGELPPFQYSKRLLNFNQYRGIDANARFTDLCQGNNLQLAEQQSQLYCYFENRKRPYLYINPVKVEQLSKDPLILQFYEIMSKSSMETIQREIGPHVKSYNLFFDKTNVAQRNSPVKVTNSARMGIRNFAKVSNATYYLTEILSGLNIIDHPNHNVLGEHVYGRHFNIHNDGVYGTNSSEIPDDEDTIATMVFYLKLPRTGGCTAFIHAGVCSRKVIGSAIFWYNMYKNGTYTKQLTHGSCPVYHGNKMAISFFFQHNANWNKRLCSVNQLE